MPTGFTDPIKDGITFPEFVMMCARGMGALMNMRDDPMDAQIPEKFSPSDYHRKEIEKLKRELEKTIKMPIKEAEVIAKKEYLKRVHEKDEYIESQKDLKKKYNDMLARVMEWEPPTPDHVGLKKFMIDQITGSIKFDISLDEDDVYIGYFGEPKQKTAEEWINENIVRIGKQIDYHKTEYEKEVARTEERNKWLRELRESLK